MNQLMINKKPLSYFLFSYSLLLILACWVLFPTGDTFYYWQWSQHLALSYYDGPPMIAYWLRFFTSLFGHSILVLNLAGMICAFLTAFFVYKTAKNVADVSTAYLAATLWLLSPLVTQDLIVRFTYDSPLNLFWAMTVYFVSCYIQRQRTLDIYRIGFAIGCMLLSKYTGIILILGLLSCMVIMPTCRSLLKNVHFYLALLIIVIMFSPVLIWNIQHQFGSFIYQLNDHKAINLTIMDRIRIVANYILGMIGNCNFLLLIPLVIGFKYKNQQSSLVLTMLNIISGVFVLFWLALSAFSYVKINYMAPFMVSGSILSAYYIMKYNYSKLAVSLISLFLLISIFIIAFNSYLVGWTGKGSKIAVAQTANQYYVVNNEPIITYGFYSAARMVYWLKGQTIHSLSCDSQQDNQFAYWDQNFKSELTHKQIKQALYLDFIDHSDCIKQHFATCRELPIIEYKKPIPFTHKIQAAQMVVYQCSNV